MTIDRPGCPDAYGDNKKVEEKKLNLIDDSFNKTDISTFCEGIINSIISSVIEDRESLGETKCNISDYE